MTIAIGGINLATSSHGEPASSDELNELRANLPGLPEEYFMLLEQANGFTGEFGEDSDYVVFYSIAEMLKWNEAQDVLANEPGFCMVGSNGSVDGFFASTIGNGRWMILPLMDVGSQDVRLEDKFETIGDFAAFISQRCPEE